VSVTPDLEAPRAARSDSFTDAVTISFGDLAAGVYGTARLGLAGGTQVSGLVLLFAGGDLVTVAAEGGVAAADASSWEGVSAAGLDLATVEPLRAWRASFAGEDAAFDLELEAAGTACALDERDPVARAGGMLGFEQPVRVRGEADLGGRRLRLDGLGQRGRSWGAPDWGDLERTRAASAWFGERAVSVAAIGRHGAGGHGQDALSATLFGPGADGCTRVEDPRLSTTFDADGRQRRAAMELWVNEDDERPVRLEGEVVCGTTLDLGRLRLDCSFLRWRLDDLDGVGRYDVLRRAPDA
jgi:hypothetical protein